MKAVGLFFRNLAIVVLLIALAAIGGAWLTAKFGNPFASAKESTSSQVIRALEREQQVVLLRLGVQDITDESEHRKFMDMEIPGTSRTPSMLLTFDAKLGLEQGEVDVRQDAPDRFTLTIPDFIFVGHENIELRLLNEENGILSWVTPQIDQQKMIETVLNDSEAQSAYIDSNEALLRDQAEEFYSGIITSIDPELKVNVEYQH